jgi:hypothetical protein
VTRFFAGGNGNPSRSDGRLAKRMRLCARGSAQSVGIMTDARLGSREQEVRHVGPMTAGAATFIERGLVSVAGIRCARAKGAIEVRPIMQ